MIKIGMNMLLWTNHITEKHYEVINRIKETGYDGIEVPVGEGSEKYHVEMGRYLSGLGLEATVVTALNPQQNIASPDKAIRETGLARLKWAIDMSDSMDARIICGPFHSAFAYFTRKPPTADEIKWSVEMLHAAGEYAAGANIILTPEAINRFECYLCNTMDGLASLLDAVDHPNVRAMYDSHHAHFEEKSQSMAIKNIQHYLRHVHISENDRGTPGKGQVHWNEVFATLKEIDYSGWLTIEAFSTIGPEFANSINVWRDYSPEAEIYEEGFRFINEQWEKAYYEKT